MISLRVAIMVLAVMLGPANVKMVSTVTIAQVNFITCNWWFADENKFVLQLKRILRKLQPNIIRKNYLKVVQDKNNSA